MSAYTFTDHSYDVVVVGAGGADDGAGHSGLGGDKAEGFGGVGGVSAGEGLLDKDADVGAAGSLNHGQTSRVGRAERDHDNITPAVHSQLTAFKSLG